MSKPWGNIGAWAAEAELAEAEEREAAAASATAGVSSFAAGGGDSQSFPSLKEAANTKQKKKGSKMSLQEFYGSAAGKSSASAFDSKGLTRDEMLRLPTGPKQRSPDEMQCGRLGGGFSSYGLGGPSTYRSENRDLDHYNRGTNRRSYGSGFDEDRSTAPPRRSSDYDNQLPSRADEVDNWKLAKKLPPQHDDVRPSRYGSLASGGTSKADEVDNWATAKRQTTPPAPARFRSSSFGTGFRDGPRPEPESWKKEEVLVKANNKPNPFGEARPREEVLAEKRLDWKKVDLESEVKKPSRPASLQSNSRPGSAQSSRSEGPTVAEGEVVKPKPKVNPFGDAKPREVLLEEKGLDWKKIDFELERRRADRPETEAERNLKEEIEDLKKELEKESAPNANRESFQGPGGDQISLQDQITCKERDLELLVRELDDKVRFGQKATERPGSGAGRVAGFTERPPSQSGSFEDTRSVEFSERPRSRGTGGAWTRQGDDRRGFRGGRSGGFLGNRDNDRSRSRERW